MIKEKKNFSIQVSQKLVGYNQICAKIISIDFKQFKT